MTQPKITQPSWTLGPERTLSLYTIVCYSIWAKRETHTCDFCLEDKSKNFDIEFCYFALLSHICLHQSLLSNVTI